MTDKQRESQIKDDIPQDSGGVKVAADQNSDNGKTRESTAQKSLESTKKPEETMSKGENVFNKTVYTGLNYWLNLIMSVGIADYALNLKGRERLDSWINKSTHLLSKMMPIKKAHHNSKIAIETFVLTSGGLILLFPLKWMEDNKRPIVHWLNKKLGIEQKTKDGKEKTPEEIHIDQEQPKQSWGNVILRRIAGTAAVVAAGLGLDHFARGNKILDPEHYNLGDGRTITYDKKVEGGKIRVTDAVFNQLNKAAKYIRGKEFAEKSTASRWTKLAILDSVFTIITAIVMKVTNGAKKGKMPQEIDNTSDPLVLDNKVNNLVTESEQERNHRIFAERVEKRTKDLIDYKRGNAGQTVSFVDAIQAKDSAIPIQAGI